MFLRKKKPYTPSMRFTILVDKSFLITSNYLKCLRIKKKKKSGRNQTGRVTVRHKGNEKKRMYYYLDRVRDSNWNIPNKVIHLSFDSNRSSWISLIVSFNGIYSLILSSYGLFEGSIIYNWKRQYGNVSLGDHLSLKEMPFGSFFFNLNKKNNIGYDIAKSAGTYCQFINKLEEENKALVRIPSGKRLILDMSMSGTVGVCSNKKHKYESLGKAGRKRNIGIRPTVRGVAMNPVDHPHGGGEGKKSGRTCPFSPWRKQPFFKKT